MENDEMLVLEGETSEMLSLMNNTFYSNKEIFFRELINNASNALDKIQSERLTDKSCLDDELTIRLVPHKANKTLSIIDTGIGMTKTDMANNLGVGFYSAYLVAHKVTITTKHNDHDHYIWESHIGLSFTIKKDLNAQQLLRGTQITLFLKDDQLEYLEETTIKNLVNKYCQLIIHPIYLWNENKKNHWQLINIWLPNQEIDNIYMAQKGRNHLPEDLAFFILSKLPLKSLKRFGCLRKSWALLLENPHFMNLFRSNFIFNQHPYYDDTSLLLRVEFDYDLSYRSTLLSLSGERFQNVEKKIHWPNQLRMNERQCCILGSSSINGIICLYRRFVKDVYLWNPTTNELKVIPPSLVHSVPYYIKPSFKYMGFGYDYVRDDYKVIRYVYFKEIGEFGLSSKIDQYSIYYDDYKPFWEIYSLRRNSWRKLGLDVTYDFDFCRDNDKIYSNGICHWLMFDESETYLGSCDLINEMCYVTNLPFETNMDCAAFLLLLNGSLTLISEDRGTFTFYILAELGMKEMWTKLFVEQLHDLASPIGARNMGNILIGTLDCKLVWFDLSTHMIEKVDVGAKMVFSHLIIHKESFLSIERINS